MVKSVVKSSTLHKTPKYPYLGETEEGRIVLFCGKDTGVIVSDPMSVYKIGYFSEGWAEYCFGVSASEVTLSND
jgi:hypothetical protein